MSCVLIVEDETQVRVLAESIIQGMGHLTLTAGNVEEALALLDSEQQIDLLFTDVRLLDQHQGGLAVAPHARATRPSIAVIYTTGEGVNDGTRALFVDPYFFLAKPYTAHHLEIAIQNALTNENSER